MWNLKYDTNEFIYKTETDPVHRKQTYGYQRGKGVGNGYIRTLGLADTNYSKSPTYERVSFQGRVCKSNLFIKSNKVSLGTQLTQSAI